MTDITRILSEIEDGDPNAANELLPLVYDELRQLAAARLRNEKPGQTLQATALVHEAYLRLLGGGQSDDWKSRGHFFGAAAEAMRRILVNRARDKSRLKRGGDRHRIDFDQVSVALDTPADQLLSLDEAIDQLSGEDSVGAELVKLRFFGGLTHSEAAAALGITRRVADRHWTYARAWLYASLKE